MSNKNMISFLDAAQRTIIGELVSQNETSLTISNPVVVNIIPQMGPGNQPTGQMALQLLPVYFREFQAVKKSPTVFTYPKSQIVMVEFEGGFDFRLHAQYTAIFNEVTKEPNTNENAPAPVLKLFEE